MFFIQLKGLSKEFSEQKPLIKNLNITISSKDILGIIGRNGEGKTTLLKLIFGELLPDTGEILLSRDDLKIGYHTQFLPISENTDVSIEEYILSNFEQLYPIHLKIQSLLQVSDSIDINQLMSLQSEFEELGGYNVLSKIEQALISLGLFEFKPEDKVNILSGGQKTRLQLAKIVILNPDILLLDEPTNHLDRESIEWLVNFIKKRNGITLIVSHDREFLNSTVNQVLEIEQGETNLYFGNYDDYFKQKSELIARNLEEIKQSNRKIKDLKSAASKKESRGIKQMNQRPDKRTFGRHSKTIMRNKAGKKMKSVKLMKRRVDQKVAHNEIIKPKKYSNIDFSIESADITSNFVLRVSNLDIVINHKELVKNLSLEILKGDRIAISGNNGSGKTTFLKEIIDSYKKPNSSIRFSNSVKLGYYSQEHEEVDLSLSVLDDFRQAIPMLEEDASAYLHRLLFTYEQLRQKTGDLSQGEKSKLVLAKLLAQHHNFLILDEPTNHLDIASRELLEKGLQNYTGSILCVSHDRYFLEKLEINKHYEIKNKQLLQK
jgi:ATPase subunit of ABC transporter with duplicated ATPase domains